MSITEDQLEELRRQAQICALEWARQASTSRLEQGIENFEPAPADWEVSLEESGIENIEQMTDRQHDRALDTFNEVFEATLETIQAHIDDFGAEKTADILRAHSGQNCLSALENDEIV